MDSWTPDLELKLEETIYELILQCTCTCRSSGVLSLDLEI